MLTSLWHRFMQNKKQSQRESSSKNKIVSQKNSSPWEKFGHGNRADIEMRMRDLKEKRRLTKKITELQTSSNSAENAAEQVAELIKSTRPLDKKNIDNILKEVRKILLESIN